MVVAVIPVGVMQMAVDEVVDVIAVRDGRMPARLAVDVTGLVPGAVMVGRAAIRVDLVEGQDVLVDVIAVRAASGTESAELPPPSLGAAAGCGVTGSLPELPGPNSVAPAGAGEAGAVAWGELTGAAFCRASARAFAFATNCARVWRTRFPVVGCASVRAITGTGAAFVALAAFARGALRAFGRTDGRARHGLSDALTAWLRECSVA